MTPPPSSSLYTVRHDCRLCHSRHLDVAFTLGNTPPANAFLTQEQLDEPEPTFPLTVALCRDCGLVQLLETVSPELLFRDYVYVSSTSPSFVAHFEQAADTLTEALELTPEGLVVDIGSNDGILLRPYQARGMRVLGIDPAREIACQATAAGIETIPEFFTTRLAERIVAERGQAQLIAATNVFAHIDDLEEVTHGIKTLLAPNGAFVFENAYLVDFLEQKLFDTVYHEHLCYYSVQPLVSFFKRFGLEVFAAERIPTHGGSLRVFVGHAGAHPIATSVADRLAEESRLRVTDLETYHAFAAAIEQNRAALRALVSEITASHGTIAGYGAPAKATTLLHYAGIGSETLSCIVDDSPWKQGRFLPGKHIPIVSSETFMATPTTHLMILAWNFAPQIIEKLTEYREKGGRVIIPVPTPHQL